MITELQPRFLDVHFARFLAGRCSLTGTDQHRFRELVQQLSAAMDSGHSCLPLSAEDSALMGGSPLVSESGNSPLILQHGSLYLHRYFTYEKRLAAQLTELAKKRYTYSNSGTKIDDCFGADEGEIDWQKRSAEVAISNALAIISGGPGTGKTTTVAKIIGLLLELEGVGLNIALAAPTGKAAMRLQESIGRSLDQLPFREDVIAAIPVHASTLHRLLGVVRYSSQFMHHGGNPLPYEVVVIDEASMVDLALMSKVVDSLKPGARLILLGDKDQLASVESGSVLTDCIGSLPENTVELRKSYRFDAGIKALADAVNKGEARQAWEILGDSNFSQISIATENYLDLVGENYLAYMTAVNEVGEEGAAELFSCFRQFQVLCANRLGQHGVYRINSVVEKYLKSHGHAVAPGSWYSGRPILITANDYGLELFNGDIGICLPDPGDGSLRVWFERGDGTLKSCLPYRIPRCETAYAMTIHKSQGSEFSEVMVIMPSEENRLLSRQLLYTAITRAKKTVQLVVTKEILECALGADFPRHSGLWRLLSK